MQDTLGIGDKNGGRDVAYAANNNMNFNRLGFENFNNMMKPIERSSNQDIEYSK